MLVKCLDASPAAMIVAVQTGAVLAALTEAQSFATGYGTPLAASDSLILSRPTLETLDWYVLFQGNTATFHVERSQ